MPSQNFIMRRLRTGRHEYPPVSAFPNMLTSAFQAALRKGFGRYPEGPWIPFSVRTALENLMRPDWTVREIGSGMSTLWLAPRVGRLTSIECMPEWYDRLNGLLAQRGVRNVDLRLRLTGEETADMSDIADHSLDLLFVDGGARAKCLENGFRKVKPGGVIYLDNWDVANFWIGSEAFLESQNSKIASRQRFIDYVPASVKPSEGLLIALKGLPG